MVGTYRDIEVDRAHPLSAVLAELRRSTSFSRVLLRGLTADEVRRMIDAIAEQDIQRALAETVHRQTEGNPLIVQEVVRYLAESGLVERTGGRWQARQYYAQALKVAQKVRFRPEVALVRLQMAELDLSPPLRADPSLAGRMKGRGTKTEPSRQYGIAVRRESIWRLRFASSRRWACSRRWSGRGGCRWSYLSPRLRSARDRSAPQVFISYSSDDRATAEALARKLEGEEIPIWLDQRDIPAGSSCDAEIVKGIRASGVVVVLCSPPAMASDHVRQELRLAMQYKKPVLPLLVQRTEFPEEVENRSPGGSGSRCSTDPRTTGTRGCSRPCAGLG